MPASSSMRAIVETRDWEICFTMRSSRGSAAGRMLLLAATELLLATTQSSNVGSRREHKPMLCAKPESIPPQEQSGVSIAGAGTQSSAQVSSLALYLCSSSALVDVSSLPLYICCFYQRKRTRVRQQAEISSVPLAFISLSLAYLDNSQPLITPSPTAGEKKSGKTSKKK
jgi:hypothetical protein